MNYILLALVTMVFFGIADFLLKKAMESGVNGITLVFYVWLIVTVFFGIFALYKSVSLKIQKKLLIYAPVTGVLVFIGALSLIYALRIGSAGVVVPIGRLGMLITVLCAVIFLKEEMNIEKILGILFAVVAIIFLSKS